MDSTTLARTLRDTWERLSRRARRTWVVVVVCPGVLLLTASAAYADGNSAPSTLSWMEITDSHDISVWKYELSLDGGGVTDTGKLLWSSLTGLIWEAYRSYVAMSIWLVDWVLSFDWLHTVADPMIGLGDSLTAIVDTFGAVPTLLTITAIAAVMWMARGRWVLGIFELLMSLVIAALAMGFLSNPIGLVAGDDGMLMQSRDLGLGVSSGLVNDGDTSGSADAMRGEVSATLADTFIRQPTQMINFGRVVDGTDCEKAWDEVVREGPYGEDDDVRSAMGDCDEAMKEVADNPNSAMAMSAGVLFPAAFIVLLFAAILSGAVLLASVQALYRGLKLILDLVLGLLPGAARGGLWMSIADLVMSLVTVVFSVVFLTAYLLLIQSVFSDGGEARIKTFFAVDLLMIVGIIVYWRGRARIKAATERLAQALAHRPGGAGPSRLPDRGRFNPTELYYKGKLAAAGAQTVGSGVAGVAAGTGRVVNRTGATVGRGIGRTGSMVGGVVGRVGSMVGRGFTGDVDADTGSSDTGSARTGSAGPAPQSSSAERLQHRLAPPRQSAGGQLVRLGAHAVAVYATGGAAVVGRATSHAACRQAAGKVTRRDALTARLRPQALPAGRGGPQLAGAASGPATTPGRPTIPSAVRGSPAAAGAPGPPAAASAGVSAGASRGVPVGYERVETNGTVTLVPRSPQQPHTHPASTAERLPASQREPARRSPTPPAVTPPLATPPAAATSSRLPAVGGAAQRLESRLAERRAHAIALPPPKPPRPGS